MKTMEERLNKLFGNVEYVKKMCTSDNFNELFAAVQKEIPEITQNELEEYLRKLATVISDGELSVDEMDNVSGGSVILASAATWAALKTAGAVVTGVVTAGLFIGRYLKGRG